MTKNIVNIVLYLNDGTYFGSSRQLSVSFCSLMKNMFSPTSVVNLRGGGGEVGELDPLHPSSTVSNGTLIQ